MRYTVTVAGTTFEVEVRGDTVSVGGEEHAATLSAVPATPLRQLILGLRSRTLAVTRNGEGWVVEWGGERHVVQVVDERTQRLRAMTASKGPARTSAVVRAPMPGLVLRLEIVVGQAVEAGTGLLVLEAMKMENEITAPVAGIVRALHVEPGQAVEKGTSLVEIAAPEA